MFSPLLLDLVWQIFNTRTCATDYHYHCSTDLQYILLFDRMTLHVCNRLVWCQTVRQIDIDYVRQIFRQNISTDLHVRQIYSLIFRSTDLQIGQTERANLLNKSINGRRRHRNFKCRQWPIWKIVFEERGLFDFCLCLPNIFKTAWLNQ